METLVMIIIWILIAYFVELNFDTFQNMNL